MVVCGGSGNLGGISDGTNTNTLAAQRAGGPSRKSRSRPEQFLHALDTLDWERFRATGASEPTVFFPFIDTLDLVTWQA